ncbi:hypothetical protein BV133_2583 [Blastochloris viridis]|uniref:Uncharacterized protein n=1 Tax=Blastochloris viridis TaxID=1079 RepID=A0A182D3U2_BLAVI|nr:hypothetical protein BV133_2583 [Blastochloris viridis]
MSQVKPQRANPIAVAIAFQFQKSGDLSKFRPTHFLCIIFQM